MRDPDTPPLRFVDNRQKYLQFVTTTNEKWKVAERAARELARLRPVPPAMRVFDAGVGDGTVLAHLLRAMHREYPTIPFYVVGKEISLEDVRLTLDKLPDRFVEHPASVIVLTNLNYAESPALKPNTDDKRARMVVHHVALEGTDSQTFGEQLLDLDDWLVEHWAVRPSETTGNPIYETPTALVVHRADQTFALDNVIPRSGEHLCDYDLVIASQPWRAKTSARFKVDKILCPLSRSLRSHGVLLGIQSSGGDPAGEIVRAVWPDEQPFPVDRHELLAELHRALGNDARDYDLMAFPDDESTLTYEMHTLPSDLGSNIGTSTLFAAWNAAIYVAQIEDQRVEAATRDGRYLEATEATLQKHGRLWFHDETFVIRRN